MSFEQSLEKIQEKYQNLADKLASAVELSRDKFVKYSKEYSDLTPIIEKIEKYLRNRVDKS